MAGRGVKVKNADNIYHKKLLRLEDKLYEIDHELYVISFLKGRIEKLGLDKCIQKIKYFESLNEYLATCKDETEFLNYLSTRIAELKEQRVDVSLTLQNKAPLLFKKSCDQRTQNRLYYDAYDFNVSSLDCLYDYLQRETFEYHEDFDLFYDVTSMNHLRQREREIEKQKFQVYETYNTETTNNNDDQNKARALNKNATTEEVNKAEDMLSVYSIEHTESEVEEIEKNQINKKVIVRKVKSLMKYAHTGADRLVYNDLKDVKKLITLDFNNKHILALTIETLIQRSDAFYLSKTRVNLLEELY